MKKKVRASNSNPFYSNEPAVARSKMADMDLSPNGNLANSTPKMVDKKPGRLSGVAGFSGGHRPKAGISTPTPKLGSSAKGVPQATLRNSGHPQAHRLGGIKPLKKI